MINSVRHWLEARRTAKAQKLLSSFMQSVGVEFVEFPGFRVWLLARANDEPSAAMAQLVTVDESYPGNGSFSEVRAYFDRVLRDEPEMHEYAMAMTMLWLTERARHKAFQPVR